MSILLSNDDGVDAIGLQWLADTLQGLSQINVVAPDRNHSGASNSLSLRTPLRTEIRRNGWISVQGTPTDCVHIAVTQLFNSSTQIVISGINEGSNLGDDVWYSGTMAAAREAVFLGLPAFAISLAGNGHCTHYQTAAFVAKQFAYYFIQNRMSLHGTLLNINVPDVPFNDLCGYEITRLGTRHPSKGAIRQLDPRGYPIYWIGPSGQENDSGPGTDFHAIKNNKVSVTPIRIDLTEYLSLNHLSNCIENFNLTNASIIA